MVVIQGPDRCLFWDGDDGGRLEAVRDSGLFQGDVKYTGEDCSQLTCTVFQHLSRNAVRSCCFVGVNVAEGPSHFMWIEHQDAWWCLLQGQLGVKVFGVLVEQGKEMV